LATVHLPIRQLVEFLLRTGSIDSRFTGFDRALEGAHIHRKLQKAAGDGYQAEVFLSVERQAEGQLTLDGVLRGHFRILSEAERRLLHPHGPAEAFGHFL